MLTVGIFLFDDIELLDFAGPYEVFSVTSQLNANDLFKVFTISEASQAITTVNGLKVIADYGFGDHPPIDILVIPGGNGTKLEMDKPQVLEWVKANHAVSQITMSVCSGARILGKLGLLNRIEATTHHEVIPQLREIAPQAVIREDLRFVESGKILTSAGISAGIDLSLAVVAKLYGEEVVRKTIKYMEYGDWRSM